MLEEKFRSAQAGNKDAALAIIEQFMPLIKKYAKKTSEEDATNDIQYRLCELIYSINLQQFKTLNDAVLTSYVSKAIHSFYVKSIKRSTANKEVVSFSELSDNQLYEVESELSAWDSYSNISLQDLHRVLTDKEYYVIYCFFYLDIPVLRIAKGLNTSRQNINQIKKSALKKIKNKLYF